jgi:uncharacterized membrane protein YfcA
MLGASFDYATLAVVLFGALVAGFTTGLAGFGTGLVASGLWVHALPAAVVPPLIVLASIAGQLVGFVTVRRAFDWSRAAPYLIGGAVGVPFGVAALATASPSVLRASVGVFLIIYAVYQLAWRREHWIGGWGGKLADGVIGMGGGFLGGFAGLPAPPPLIWLQLRGGDSDRQRAIYQPFNLIVLMLAAGGMAISRQITADVLWIALFCLPATLIGAFIGARIYSGVSARTFQRVVLGLLLISGCILIGQTMGS